MNEWIDISDKVKSSQPVIDRSFLEMYIDDYAKRTFYVYSKHKKIGCENVLRFKEQNIDYVLNNNWEKILEDQLHKITTKYQFHRSLESMFFMDLVETMIAAEIASNTKMYSDEKISLNQGSLHFMNPLQFGIRATHFYHIAIHIIMGSYHRSILDDEEFPKLFVDIHKDDGSGTYRNELNKRTEELYSRIDAICLSENVMIERHRPISWEAKNQGIKPAILQSIHCKWIDKREHTIKEDA